MRFLKNQAVENNDSFKSCVPMALSCVGAKPEDSWQNESWQNQENAVLFPSL